MNTDKQNFQQWLGSNRNLTHAIHITPNQFSDAYMKNVLSHVNYKLNKTFLCKRFSQFENQFDRFMFIVFREYQYAEVGRHYHVLVHSPSSVTKQYQGRCFCRQRSNKPCELCVEFRLEDIFKELKENLKTTVRNTTTDSEYDGSQQVYVSKQLPSNFTGDYVNDNFYIIGK